MTKEERAQLIRELARARWGKTLLSVPKVEPKPQREKGRPYRCHFTRTQMIRTEPKKKWIAVSDEVIAEQLRPNERHGEHFLTAIARKLAVKPKREA
jgi:hypothetical protein